MQDGNESQGEPINVDTNTGEILEEPMVAVREPVETPEQNQEQSQQASEVPADIARDIPSVSANKRGSWVALIPVVFGLVVLATLAWPDAKEKIERTAIALEEGIRGSRVETFRDDWDEGDSSEAVSDQSSSASNAPGEGDDRYCPQGERCRRNVGSANPNNGGVFSQAPYGAPAAGALTPAAINRLQLEAVYGDPEVVANGGGGSRGRASARREDPYAQGQPYNPYESSAADMNGLAKTLASSLQAGSVDERNQNERFMDRTKNKAVEVVQATRQYNLAYLIPQGKYIHCVLSTALNSQLPGQTLCTITRDVYGAQGRKILIPKGSTAYGEYNSGVLRGQVNVFVAWSRIRTPDGVDIPIGSPGADNLGRSGYGGEVDRHFWLRFGNATLLSLLGATAANAGSQGQLPNASSAYRNAISTSFQMSSARALEQNMDIDDTIYKDQGEPVMIFVARDIDFTRVYQSYARR